MKTETRSIILKIIEEKGKARPSELQEALNITAQTVHYHLRNLVQKGLIEAKGSVPFTQYALAGSPDFEAAFDWLNAPILTKNPEAVCETREIFTARLPRLQSFVKNGLAENLVPFVVSTAGEIGNNSFDHNLGQWRDVPGCWFEPQATGRQLWICIADRGQGIFQSLVKVHPHLTDDQAALKAAFETTISGRTPENRGNGLKFVRNNLSISAGAGLACISGNGQVCYGEQGERGLAFLRKKFTKVQGTVTLIIWRLQ